MTTKGPIPPPVTEQIEDISTVLEPPAEDVYFAPLTSENAGPIEAISIGPASFVDVDDFVAPERKDDDE